jgi:type I restriction enzyme S subunit
MGAIWSSQDVLKVEPDPEKISAGYLYAFLASRFGEAFIKASVYGSTVKHIEPHHLVDLPVPRFDCALEQRIHDLVEESAHLRAACQAGLTAATNDLFRSVGLPELIDYRWHKEGRDLDFQVTGVGTQSIRALNYSPRARRLVSRLASVEHRTLGDICAGGLLASGVRFKRIDSDREHGAQLIGQRQGFWARPEGRWISAAAAPTGIFAEEETVLIASQGTLGEQEVFCRPIMVYGSWVGHAYTQHFLRIASGDPAVSGAYLFAFLRSEAAFRVLRSLSVGGKQQDIHEGLRRSIPIPLAPEADRVRIAETVRQAHRNRDRADALEDEALSLLTAAIDGAEG